MPKKGTKSWTKFDIECCVLMWKDGATCGEIGSVIEKTPASVSGFIRKHREEYDLPTRGKAAPAFNNGRSCRGFDYEWQGGVSYKHPLLTQKWGSK